MFDEVGGHLAATDGNKAQVLELLGQRRCAGAERQQQAQQFGHQHQTVGRPAQQGLPQHGWIERTGTGETELPEGRNAAAGAGQQRHIEAGDVLKQGRQRQQGEVFFHLGWRDPLGQRMAHRHHLGQ